MAGKTYIGVWKGKQIPLNGVHDMSHEAHKYTRRGEVETDEPLQLGATESMVRTMAQEVPGYLKVRAQVGRHRCNTKFIFNFKKWFVWNFEHLTFPFFINIAWTLHSGKVH